MDELPNPNAVSSKDNVSSDIPYKDSVTNVPLAPPNEIKKEPLPVNIPLNGVPPKAKQDQLRILHPPLLWKQLQEVYSALEQKLGGPVVGYYTTSSIVNDDVKYFYSHLASGGFRDKIYFVLYTSGGDGKSAYRIASLLKSFCNELVIVIPEMAASAGTMLCLAGDKIMMTPLSYLTAVDTSIVHPLNPKDPSNKPVSVELEEVRRAVEVLEKTSGDQSKSDVYKTIFNYIHPVAYGNVARKANLSEMLCKDLLKLRRNTIEEDKGNLLIEKLNHSLPAHGYPITRDIALEIGLPVENTSPEIDNLLWKFINLNRALTEPVRTDINDSFFHMEKILNVIESVGRRLDIINIYERRLDPIIKGWTTIKELYKWEATYEVEEDGKKRVVLSNLDL